MLNQFRQMLRQLAARANRPAEGEGPASVLMEHADRRAGLDARQARDLRRAARAYLRVVR